MDKEQTDSPAREAMSIFVVVLFGAVLFVAMVVAGFSLIAGRDLHAIAASLFAMLMDRLIAAMLRGPS